MNEASRVPASFRDPSGFVFRRDGILYRQVNRRFAGSFDRLASSGLYDALTEDGLLIPHDEVDVALAAGPDAHRVIRPDPLAFVSYPYEWSFGFLKGAALTTLRAQRRALDHGMTLRDASAYNVQFHRGRPVLIDSLSFEPVREGQPWRAYAQFCRHFLAPLALMAGRDVRLGQLLRSNVDGIPLDLASRLLPSRFRARPSLWLHLVAHARAQARHGAGGVPEVRGRFSMRAFRGLVDSLERAVRKLDWEPPASTWSGYYGDCPTYEEETLREKKEGVARSVEEVGPRSVWDLGANTGRFSRLASSRGIFTLALDSDPAVIERAFRESSGDPWLLPLVIDLTNPSPAIGWGNEERLSLAQRGPADLVLALALVHHLAVAGDVPLDRVAAYVAELGRNAVVEWVPREDPQVREMMATRDHAFDGYTGAGFEAAFGRRFEVLRRQALPGSERILYLLRRR